MISLLKQNFRIWTNGEYRLSLSKPKESLRNIFLSNVSSAENKMWDDGILDERREAKKGEKMFCFTRSLNPLTNLT